MSVPENVAEHPDDCEVAWTITMHHNGVATFENCPEMSPDQRAVAQRFLEWVSAPVREQARREREAVRSKGAKRGRR